MSARSIDSGTVSASVRLTSLAHGAGCGCKLPADQLHRLLAGLPVHDDDRVLVGFAGADDAAVTLIAENLALVQTVDFFTPIVDDPEDFGAIAAANALSDVYAMGGRPLSALSVVGFPLQRLGGQVLRSIVAGAIDTLQIAGVPLVGGHSIDDPEPKFGLAVAGIVDPDRILRNSGAVPGDSLVLTKPLGTGVIATHAKQADVDPETLTEAVAVMRLLTRAPASRRSAPARMRRPTSPASGCSAMRTESRGRAASRSRLTPARSRSSAAPVSCSPAGLGSPAEPVATPNGPPRSLASMPRSPSGNGGSWPTRRHPGDC